MHPSYSDIIYFLEVAKTLNVSRAAERLGISQPSLSTSIRRLESCLNSDLFIRNKAGVQLTKTGHFFLQQSKDLVLRWENLKNAIENSNEEAVGRYRLGCHASVALYTLHHFLPQLLKSNPRLELDLVHDLSRVICERVVSFEVDYGIVINPVAHPDLVIKNLFEDTVRFWVAADSKKPDTSVLICDSALLQTQDLLQKLKKKNRVFQRVLPCGNLEVLTSLVASGAGVGIIPQRVVENSTADLKIFRKDDPTFQDRLCLVYRSDVPRTYAHRQIIEAIQTLR